MENKGEKLYQDIIDNLDKAEVLIGENDLDKDQINKIKDLTKTLEDKLKNR